MAFVKPFWRTQQTEQKTTNTHIKTRKNNKQLHVMRKAKTFKKDCPAETNGTQKTTAPSRHIEAQLKGMKHLPRNVPKELVDALVYVFLVESLDNLSAFPCVFLLFLDWHPTSQTWFWCILVHSCWVRLVHAHAVWWLTCVRSWCTYSNPAGQGFQISQRNGCG